MKLQLNIKSLLKRQATSKQGVKIIKFLTSCKKIAKINQLKQKKNFETF